MNRSDKMAPDVVYFKRYRMEIDLTVDLRQEPGLPDGYFFVPWRRSLVAAHALAKFHSFRTEIDANVFPCLGSHDGCQRLMKEISLKDGFLAEATWLVARGPLRARRPEYCGTVQGIRDPSGMGAIQNLGVVPQHRGQRIGRSLLLQALLGFQRAGLDRAYLEVTAENDGAIRLYERIGFRTVRTVYKVAEPAGV